MKRILSALLMSALVACSSGSDRARDVSATPSIDSDGVQRIKVTMHSNFFEPNRIVVQSGKPVEIILDNASEVVPHNFSIHEGGLSISEDKWGPGNDTVRFIPTQTGQFRFYCNKSDHAEEGMVGTLVVVD